MADMEDSEAAEKLPAPEFKKPVLIGRVGKLPRKAKPEDEPAPPPPPPVPAAPEARTSLPPAVLLKELAVPIPYKEPKWSGMPPEGSNYSLEVLKSGVIVDKVDLSTRPYHVFGRLANCHIVMAHPTISRHHAVLQYKAQTADGERPVGWYVWDAGSTHGTLLNRERVAPAHYARVRVGHLLRFGASTRSFILLGPEWDSEGESELSVTELKQKHAEMKAERERRLLAAAQVREDEERRREESGVDWGMGDDAEEESDLAENPFAATTNEQLYLDDPKKTLRGYYEREGLELQYDCQEKGVGQFVCRVELPVEDAGGRPLVAEAVHRGKKKEAVVACALEACRVLDRHGLLRQAKHESRRRKQRDWSADDYYDSDDDNYLDRTGAVERRRRLRMQRHGGERPSAGGAPLTYGDLMGRAAEQRARLAGEEARLAALRAAGAARGDAEADALDSYMSELASLGTSMAQKAEISKLKMEIVKLKAELANTERLTEVAKPTSLPALVKQEPTAETSRLKVNKIGQSSVVYGKRMRLKEEVKVKVKRNIVTRVDEDFVEEVDSDEEERLAGDGETGKEENTRNPGTDEKVEKTSKEDERLASESELEISMDSTKNLGKRSSKNYGLTLESEESQKGEKYYSRKDHESHLKEETIDKEKSKEIDNHSLSNISRKDKKDTEKSESKQECREKGIVEKRVFGPMRPPDDYVVPEDYYQAETDRDLPEIMEDDI